MMKGIDTLGSISVLNKNKEVQNPNNKNNFFAVLQNSLNEVNNIQKNAENAMNSIATGEVKDLHQAAIAIDKAEISMKMMLEVRNKALSAYKDILRTQL